MEYTKVIAMQERSAGNESVGSMWIETASFDKDTPISEIMEWSKFSKGRLMIAIDESTYPKSDF